MKVLIVIDSFSFGGAENLLAVMAGAADQVGLDLHVASLAPRAQGRNALHGVLEEAGLETSFLDIPRLAYPAAIPRIARAVRRTGCDVVHAHLGYSAILAPPAARLAGRGCVATLHHVPDDMAFPERVKEWMCVSSAGRLGRLVFVSEAARREFATRYAERPETWRTVYNGVDLSRFTPGDDSFPADLGLRADGPVVTVVAALREPKGHRYAIEAWPQVRARVPGAQLLIVGDGDARGGLQEQARAAGLAGSVVFAGVRADVPRLMRASTLVALPSMTEALPTALIEAGACGRAVVATTVGGTPEVVRDGVTGLLVAPGGSSEFADAVVSLLEDPVRRRTMELAARQHVEQQFDLQVWMRRLMQLYEEVGACRTAS